MIEKCAIISSVDVMELHYKRSVIVIKKCTYTLTLRLTFDLVASVFLEMRYIQDNC
jgi:hypothetical protein